MPFYPSPDSGALDLSRYTVFDRVELDGNEKYQELLDCLPPSRGQPQGIVIGDVSLSGITTTLSLLSSNFHLCQSLNMQGFTVRRSQAFNTFNFLTSLSLVSTTMPLDAFPLFRNLEILELADARLSGEDMIIQSKDRPRLKTLMLDHCADPRVPILLFNILDCTSLKVLESTTKEMVQGRDGSFMYLHNMIIDVARTSLETLTLSVEEKYARRECFYDWKRVPNLKHFALKFTAHPNHLYDRLIDSYWATTVDLILLNLRIISSVRWSKVQGVGLYFDDFYDHPAVAMDLPQRCEIQPETWSAIGDTLVAISRALQGIPLTVDIRMRAFIDTTLNDMDIDESMFCGSTIERWFSKSVITSHNNMQAIDLKASMNCSTLKDFLEDYT